MHHLPSLRTRQWAFGIGRVAVALLAFVLMASAAIAAVPTTGTFAGLDAAHGQRVTFTPPGKGQITDWTGVLNLQLDKDVKGDRQGPVVKVFCIQLFVVVGRPGSVDTYFSNGSVTAIKPGGCYIRYLLAHYPASGVTTQAEGAARQLAIWHFSDALDLNTVQDAAIRTRALALAAEAQTQVDTNGCPGTNTGLATLTLTPSNATVPQGQPVPFTVQISPAGAAPSVTITVDGGSVLDNGQQSATLTFSNGVATFNVTNPNPGTVNVSAAVPYVMDEGTVFESDKTPKTQRLVLGESLSLTANAQVQAIFQQATPTSTVLNTETPTVVATSTPSNDTATPTVTSNTATPSNDTATPTDVVVISTPTDTPHRNPTRTPSFVDATVTPTLPSGGETATSTPGGGGESTPTVVSSDSTTPTPVADTGETPAATPGSADGTTVPNTASQANQPNGTRPRSLPNTGETPQRSAEWLLALAAALVVAGLALQRRGARR